MKLPLTIKETQEGLLKRNYSSKEVVKYLLSRIEEKDKKINSFITVSKDIALKRADWVDKKIKEGGKSAFVKHPLLGIAGSLKDMYLTKDIKTTAGSELLENYVPKYSSTVYKKLQNAGFIIIGKNNQDAWAHGASGENSDYKPTKNPWNLNYVPGGSSSGAAAAVASGFSVFSMGTDTGGSVRMPSAYCGVSGLKPTYGAVSRYGVVAMASSLDSMGNIAHSVEDNEIIFNSTKGADGFDSNVNEIEHPEIRKKVKIGIPKEYFGKGLSSQIKNITLEAIKTLKKASYEFVDISLKHTKYGVSVYYIIQPAEVSSNLARYDGIRYGNNRKYFAHEAERRIMLGTYSLSSGYVDKYYQKALKVKDIIINEFSIAFEKVYAIIAPVSPIPPYKLGEKSSNPLKLYLMDVYTETANLAGVPAISIPCGFSKNGLPVGFQLLGRRFSENLLFDIGKRYQKETSWHEKTPNL
jgi:aspartyl-tRNA(Asn)/glutamyl-tRNA(Gln) amidotransferase subunit A